MNSAGNKMIINPALVCAVTATLLAGCAISTQKSRSYSNTTPIPAGVSAPDKLRTRFGTLYFVDGSPDTASAKKIFDNLDYQRAVQAYLLAMPVASQVAWRNGLLEWGPPNSTVMIFEQMADPRTLALTVDNNTPYTMIALDLRDGPVVVEVPPKVIGEANDMWMHWVGDVGITGPDRGEGGKYLLLPPGYQGEVPEGYFVSRAETFGLWILWRSLPVDGDPKPVVDLIKKITKTYLLADATNPPPVKFVNVSGKYFNTIAPADFSVWEHLNEVVQKEPTDTIDPTTLGFWASVGIQKGKPFAPDARMKRILTEAAAAGDATARALVYHARIKDAHLSTNSAWRTFQVGNYRFEDSGVPVLDAVAGYCFYFLGVTPSVDTKLVGIGSQYAVAFHDTKGHLMSGGENYRLHLPPNVPAREFWSVILYDSQTRSMLQTDQAWPAVSSRTKGLLVNADGSVDIYFGPAVPPGRETNWIQTVPGKGWSIIFRLYGPLDPWFNKKWKPGEIEPVD